MRTRKGISSDVEEVRKAMVATKDLGQFQRLQCVYLGDKHPEWTVLEIADTVGVSEACVRNIHARFRKVGFECIVDKRGTRNRAHLTLEQEAQVLAEFEESSQAGHLIVIATVKQSYERVCAKSVAPSTVYRMLARHGFRKIVPYKRHPRHNAAEQEALKKTSLKS